MTRKEMTVKELIELLKKFDKNAVVRAEGCQQCVHSITGAENPEGYFKNEVWITTKE